MPKSLPIKIALLTGAAILAVKLLSTLLVYHFLSFDIYLAIVAVAFLLAGMLLFPRLQKVQPAPAVGDEVLPAEPRLTNRELGIFEMLGEGLTNKEIAELLCIEVSTVKSHINTLYPKIGCRNRIEARDAWKKLQQKV